MRDEVLIGKKEVAALLGFTVAGLEHWYREGKPAPPHFLIGGRYRYRRSEVLAWIEARRVRNA